MKKWNAKQFGGLVCALAVCAVALTGCSKTEAEAEVVVEEQEVITIRIAHDNSVTTPLHQAYLEFEELVETASEGRMDVVIFPGGQMGSVQDTFEQTQRGDIEMSGSTTSNFTSTIPEFAVWESFYMFDDTDHAKRVFESETGVAMMEPLDEMGLTGIGYMELGFRNFSNSKHAIETADDLAGLKIRGYNSLQIKAWESVGVNTTSVSWTELFTSLQQNLIDGQECATTSFYSEKFYEAQEYWSLTQHVFTNFLWYANSDFMNSLSAEDQALIMDCAQQAIDCNWELATEAEAEILDQLEADGYAVNEVDIEVRRELGEVINAAIKEDIVASCGEELYTTVMDAVVAERQ